MRKVKMATPIDHMSGSIDGMVANGRKNVTRWAKVGEDQNGKPIYKQQVYIYHLCEHEWPAGAQRNRQLFQAAQKQAREELKNEERRAYWENRYAEHRRDHRQGERLYITIQGFVSAQIHAELKANAPSE